MKKIQWLAAIIVICGLSSCARPLTDSLIAKWDAGSRLENYQYYVSQKINLDRAELEVTSDVEKGKGKTLTIIENDHVTIKRSTPGVALSYRRLPYGNTYELEIAFEDNDNNRITFRRRRDGTNPYYYIVTNDDDTIQYGDDEYSYSTPIQREWFGLGKEKKEQTPYLLIKGSDNTRQKYNSRTVKGRKLE